MKLETESIRQCFQELVSGLLRGVQMSLQPVFIHSFIQRCLGASSRQGPGWTLGTDTIHREAKVQSATLVKGRSPNPLASSSCQVANLFMPSVPYWCSMVVY